jgi:LacI family transcriptional regulator
MSTMKRIATEAGVSQATVSRVVSGSASVSGEKRRAVAEVVKRLSYVRNRSAAGLASRRSYLLGLIVPELGNPFFGEIVHHIGIEANHHGYNIIICTSEGDPRNERRLLDSLRGRQVEGIMIAGSTYDSLVFKTLKNINVATVLFAQEHEGFNSVCVDHEKGGELAAKHLLDLGYDRFAFVGSPDDLKLPGFVRALQAHNLDLPPQNILQVGIWGEEVAHKAHELGLRFFKSRGELPATAVFAKNDIAAFGILQALQELNLRVPDDVALVGFDNTFISRGTRPSLTSVAQPMEEIGRSTLELLLSRVEEKEKSKPLQLRLKPRLVVRQSTRGFEI